jgi:hypothetical protein
LAPDLESFGFSRIVVIPRGVPHMASGSAFVAGAFLREITRLASYSHLYQQQLMMWILYVVGKN